MRISRAVPLATLAVVAFVPHAFAATSGCINAADLAGDQKIGFNGAHTPAPAAANQDVTHITFTPHQSFDGTDTYLIARLDVPALDQTVAPGTFGMVYRLFYTTDDGVSRFWEADFSTLFGGPSFSTGHFGNTGLVSDGNGTGEWVNGPNGYITALLPVDPATTITAVSWNASTDEVAVIAESDVVPDAGGLTYKGTKCTPVIDPPEDEE